MGLYSGRLIMEKIFAFGIFFFWGGERGMGRGRGRGRGKGRGERRLNFGGTQSLKRDYDQKVTFLFYSYFENTSAKSQVKIPKGGLIILTAIFEIGLPSLFNSKMAWHNFETWGERK